MACWPATVTVVVADSPALVELTGSPSEAVPRRRAAAGQAVDDYKSRDQRAVETEAGIVAETGAGAESGVVTEAGIGAETEAEAGSCSGSRIDYMDA